MRRFVLTVRFLVVVVDVVVVDVVVVDVVVKAELGRKLLNVTRCG